MKEVYLLDPDDIVPNAERIVLHNLFKDVLAANFSRDTEVVSCHSSPSETGSIVFVSHLHDGPRPSVYVGSWLAKRLDGVGLFLDHTTKTAKASMATTARQGLALIVLRLVTDGIINGKGVSPVHLDANPWLYDEVESLLATTRMDEEVYLVYTVKGGGYPVEHTVSIPDRHAPSCPGSNGLLWQSMVNFTTAGIVEPCNSFDPTFEPGVLFRSIDGGFAKEVLQYFTGKFSAVV